MNITRLRADTPSCESYVHFNNAGASPAPEPVHQAVLRHLELERQIGGYAAQEAAEWDLAAFYTEAAALIGAETEEIAFVENATRAWDLAFYGLAFEPGDHVLTHGSEYVSNYLALLHRAKTSGIRIELVPSDASGQVDVAALEAMITPQTKLIALTHVPANNGLVNPAETVGAVAGRHGIPYLLDACQSVGQLDVDVRKLGCDMLCATGRKYLRAPRGTGFLYVRRGFIDKLEPPFVDLRSADWTAPAAYTLKATAQRFETWERHVAGQIGLTEAIRYARGIGMPVIEARISDLANALRAQIADIPGATVHDLGHRRCGIVTFLLPSEDAVQTAARLKSAGIMVSVASQGLGRLDYEASELTALVRASLHYFNDDEDIFRFMSTLK